MTAFNIVGKTTKVSFDYDALLKHSNLIATLKYDEDDIKEIPVPTVTSYTEDEVLAKLQIISDALRLDTPSISETLHPDSIYRIYSDFPSLHLLFTLCNFLDSQVLIDNVIEMLVFYDPKIEDIPEYMYIAEILRKPKVVTAFMNKVCLALLSNDDAIEDTSTIKLIQKIVDNSNIDHYNRTILSMKYKLYKITSPQEDNLTAMRKLTALDEVSPSIKDEYNMVTTSVNGVSEAIVKYNNMVRIALDSKCRACIGNDTLGLFWFYVDKLMFNDAGKAIGYEIGTVDVNGKTYTLRIIDHNLLGITANRKYHPDFRLYENSLLTEGIRYALVYFNILKADYNFKEWLRSRTLLTSAETGFQRRIEATVTKYDELSVLRQILPPRLTKRQTEPTIELTTDEREHILHEIHLIEDEIVQLSSSLAFDEYNYYTSEVGMKIDIDRRNYHYEYLSSKYNGMLYLCQAYVVASIDDDIVTLRSLGESRAISNVYIPPYPNAKGIAGTKGGKLNFPYHEIIKDIVPPSYFKLSTRVVDVVIVDPSCVTDNDLASNKVLVYPPDMPMMYVTFRDHDPENMPKNDKAITPLYLMYLYEKGEVVDIKAMYTTVTKSAVQKRR